METGERLAILETKVSTLQDNADRIMAKLEDIDHKLTKQKGFLGGVMFLIMAMATAVGFAKDYLFHGMYS